MWNTTFRVILALGLGLGALYLTIPNAFSSELQKKTTEMFDPSVRLGSSEKGYCSGEIIHSDRDKKTGEVETIILTAKHCVLDKPFGSTTEVSKMNYDKNLRQVSSNVYKAIVDGKCSASDVAFLKLKDKDTLFSEVARIAPSETPLSFGQETHIVGYPLGLTMTYTKGTLGFVEDMNFGGISTSHEFLRSTPNIAPGSSGSSMFTLVDGEYQIIGVTTGGWNLGTFMNYFTPTNELNTCWDDYRWRLKTNKVEEKDDSTQED